MLVGSNPAPSPVDKDFDPRRVPRIRATDDPALSNDMYDWIENLEKNPRNRYISDGVPGTITIPREMENRIDPGKLGAKKLKIYDPE